MRKRLRLQLLLHVISVCGISYMLASERAVNRTRYSTNYNQLGYGGMTHVAHSEKRSEENRS